MKKIGIVGCGAIGTEIAHAIKRKIIPASLTAVCDTDVSRCESLVKTTHLKPRISSLSQLVSISDIVVEAAGVRAVKDIARECIKKHKILLIMSAGALLNDPHLVTKARKQNCTIIIPSGALAGLDAVKAAKLGGIKSVTLTTTKPPRGLRGAPYFKKHKIDLEKITEPTLVFKGNASFRNRVRAC